MAFFCGNLRRDELPTALKAADIPFEELVVYTTEELKKTVQAEQYDAICFFSPSGVKSFASANSFPPHVHYIAIGPTNG